jgi:ubiquinone/menaquinone biosynthesis C-methylase UbiE
MDQPPVSPELLALRSRSFGGQAAAYAAERPGYPDAAVAWLLEPVAGRSPLRVLDLAAGTGKLTAGLLRHTAHVVAVEPDAAMLAELRRTLPGVRALAGTAEDLPLPDGSVDAVVAGQAMHWFDLDRAAPEMARVLAPGGVVGGLWNREDDDVPWVSGYLRIARGPFAVRRREGIARLRLGPRFSALEEATFRHAQRRTPESLAATLGTQSHVLVMPAAERAALMDRVLRYLRERPETSDGFDLPLVTMAVRATLDRS